MDVARNRIKSFPSWSLRVEGGRERRVVGIDSKLTEMSTSISGDLWLKSEGSPVEALMERCWRKQRKICGWNIGAENVKQREGKEGFLIVDAISSNPWSWCLIQPTSLVKKKTKQKTKLGHWPWCNDFVLLLFMCPVFYTKSRNTFKKWWRRITEKSA